MALHERHPADSVDYEDSFESRSNTPRSPAAPRAGAHAYQGSGDIHSISFDEDRSTSTTPFAAPASRNGVAPSQQPSPPGSDARTPVSASAAANVAPSSIGQGWAGTASAHSGASSRAASERFQLGDDEHVEIVHQHSSHGSQAATAGASVSTSASTAPSPPAVSPRARAPSPLSGAGPSQLQSLPPASPKTAGTPTAALSPMASAQNSSTLLPQTHSGSSTKQLSEPGSGQQQTNHQQSQVQAQPQWAHQQQQQQQQQQPSSQMHSQRTSLTPESSGQAMQRQHPAQHAQQHSDMGSCYEEEGAFSLGAQIASHDRQAAGHTAASSAQQHKQGPSSAAPARAPATPTKHEALLSPSHSSPAKAVSRAQQQQPPQQQQQQQQKRPVSAPHKRPASAPRQRAQTPQGHAGRKEAQQGAVPPEFWTVCDVCDWVESLGLAQYRKKFSHNSVDGRLLLRLTDLELKAELGIGPLGHRVTLLEAIGQLLNGSSTWQPSMRGVGREGPSARPRSVGGRRPGSAGGRRPMSAPGQRPPAGTTSQGLIPGDPYLGPASGKQTVQEQRAKILFELSRAEARAAAQASAVRERDETARIAKDEVLRLKGLLGALEGSNRAQVDHSTGTLDSRARIPWRATGIGTRACDPHPERFARPWEHPDTDLTFQPRISSVSRKIMAGGGGEGAGGGQGFLERLASDNKRRAVKAKELEKKVHDIECAVDPTRTAAQMQRDRAFVFEHCATQWGNTIAALNPRAKGGGSSAGCEPQLDEVIQAQAKDLDIGDKQVQKLLAAGADEKVAGLAAAIKTKVFMDRYRSDIATRDTRLMELQKRFFAQSAKGPATDDKDHTNALLWFASLGWGNDADDASDDRLAALLARASHYRAELDKLREKERDASPGRRAALVPSVAWDKAPWSSDGLGPLMQQHERHSASSASDTKKDSSKAPPSSHKGGMYSLAPPAGVSWLEYTVKLLSGQRPDALARLERLAGHAKQLGVYRAIRTQRFLEFTEAEMAAHDAKLQRQYQEIEAARRGKIVSKEVLEAFAARLQADGNRRKQALASAVQDKVSREAKQLASSYTPASPRGKSRDAASHGAGGSASAGALVRPQSAGPSVSAGAASSKAAAGAAGSVAARPSTASASTGSKAAAAGVATSNTAGSSTGGLIDAVRPKSAAARH